MGKHFQTNIDTQLLLAECGTTDLALLATLTKPELKGMIPPREMLNISRCFRTDDRTETMVTCSVDHPVVFGPESGHGKTVRGTLFHGAIHCVQHDDHVAVQYYLQTNPNGWIPGWAVDLGICDAHIIPLWTSIQEYAKRLRDEAPW